MPQVQGLEFAEAFLAKGCVAPHIVLMSGNWSEADEARAARLGSASVAEESLDRPAAHGVKAELLLKAPRDLGGERGALGRWELAIGG